ncbi:MAG: hypothetical protein KJ939_06225 [Nanoarchaeota archaeon]|nr:hypothetical protein [Nanoarchaeota archaeon]MBU4352645.1 hypothetical protein [Nanoarchaeota archaeon]
MEVTEEYQLERDNQEVNLKPKEETLDVKLERTFTSEEVTSIILEASNMQIRQEFQLKKKKFNEETAQEQVAINSNPNQYSIDNIYELARKYDIPEHYIPKAINNHKLSLEEQISDLQKFGINKSWRIKKLDDKKKKRQKRKFKYTYGQELIRAIEEAFPADEFKAKWHRLILNSDGDHTRLNIYKITETSKKRIFGKGRKIKHKCKKLVGVIFGKYPSYGDKLKIIIYDPLFLRKCGTELEELNKLSRQIYEMRESFDLRIIRDYELELPSN